MVKNSVLNLSCKLQASLEANRGIEKVKASWFYWTQLGSRCAMPLTIRWDGFLFGNSRSRCVFFWVLDTRSFQAEPLFGLRLLSLDAQMREFWRKFRRCDCLMPTGLVTTWRRTRGAALESLLFSMIWWKKILQWMCFCGLGIRETEIQPLRL